MLRKSTPILLKISAFISLILGIVFTFSILTIVVMIFISRQDFNFAKLFAINIVLIIIAIAVFLFFFGIYEFLRHLISVENEINYLEDEMKSIKLGEKLGK